jgi:5-formyltetrahydrofolate cyclo-ligase
LDSKLNLRKHFREQEKSWREMMGQQLLQEQRKLTQNLVEFLKTKKEVWCGYQALPDEASVSIVVEQSQHIHWAFPKVHGDELSFWAPKNSTNFLSGAFGIQEPDEKNSSPVGLDKIRGMLIPGQAFDREGRRLGRGKSYYDRALKQFKGLKVGVCFSPRLSEVDLPQETWDISMDYVITEKEVILCPKK